jgi:hypothetical protein
MKWNLVFGSLVLSMGLCTQGFGGILLDRMLGAGGYGCGNCCEPKCGVVEPACGIAQGCCNTGCGSRCGGCGLFGHLFSGCGCRKGCGNGCCEPTCAAEPTCGVKACEPACEAPSACCPQRSCCRPSLFGWLGHCGCKSRCNGCGNGCAEPACGVAKACCEPTCGVSNGCGNGCGCRRRCGCGLGCFSLRGLFPCHRGCYSRCGGCCTNGCTNGCCTSGEAVESTEAEGDGEIPPAPMVDPSAFLPNARIINASAVR